MLHADYMESQWETRPQSRDPIEGIEVTGNDPNEDLTRRRVGCPGEDSFQRGFRSLQGHALVIEP